MTNNILKMAVVLAGLTFAPMTALAEDVTLDPITAAGKVIFEETAGGVGCAMCHGMGALGDVGPDIRGRDSVAILGQLKKNPDMKFIKLTKEEVDQVATYLRYLHDLEDH